MHTIDILKNTEIEITEPRLDKLVALMDKLPLGKNVEVLPVYSEVGFGFQEYLFTNGQQVPQDTLVGIEVSADFYLLEDIQYSPEAWEA